MKTTQIIQNFGLGSSFDVNKHPPEKSLHLFFIKLVNILLFFARTEDDAAVAMEGEIVSQWEDGEHNRMAGGGAGQHTPGASEKSSLRGNSVKLRAQELPRYKAGRGRTKVHDPTSTGTPAAAATQPTPESVGCKRPTPDWP